MKKLVKCSAPNLEHAVYDYYKTTDNKHVFVGVRINEQYYEHDETTNQWYKLIDNKEVTK